MLGERILPPWWRTQFLTDFGLRALARVFPRCAASAAVSSVSIAARIEHDKRIGLSGKYHLFRLPRELEHGIMLLMADEEFSIQTSTLELEGPNDLIRRLATIARGRMETAADGPVRIGVIASITQPAGLETLAVHYQQSFEANRRAFPYFGDMERQP
jgi:hypothetical protein